MPGPYHTLSLALPCPFSLKYPALLPTHAGRHTGLQGTNPASSYAFFFSLFLLGEQILQYQVYGVYHAAWLGHPWYPGLFLVSEGEKASGLVVLTSLSVNSKGAPYIQKDCEVRPYSDPKLEPGFSAHFTFSRDLMVYFTDVPGRRREQAVLKTTSKVLIVRLGPRLKLWVQGHSVFGDAQLPGGRQE